MNRYQEVKERQQKAYDDFANKNCFFAFSQEQFDKGMAKLGLNPDDVGKIYSIGHGGFILREKSKEHAQLFDKLDAEMQEHMKDDAFLVDAFKYELGNHEYCITRDLTDTLEALGISEDEFQNDSRLIAACRKARDSYMAEMMKLGW